MKKIGFYSSVFLLLTFDPQPANAQTAPDQATAPASYSGAVKYIGSTEKGTVTVQSTGFANKKPGSDANAAATALYTLLFRGFPGSAYELPMIPDEGGKKDDPTIKSLLKGGYGSFITEDVTEYTEIKKKRADGIKGVLTLHTITFNCDALRRYLEQQSVIRTFGL